MKKLIIFILILFFITESNAKGKYTIKIGVNYSDFIGEKRNSEPGIVLGIGREWPITKYTTISGEINYSVQETYLKNKKIKPNNWNFYDVTEEDIICSLRCFELPFNIKQYFNLGKNFKLQLNIGAFLNVHTKDLSERELKRYYVLDFLNEEERKNFKFNYRSTSMSEDYSYNASRLNYEFGFGFVWSRYQLECRYQIKRVKWISFVYIDKRMETFQLLLGVNL